MSVKQPLEKQRSKEYLNLNLRILNMTNSFEIELFWVTSIVEKGFCATLVFYAKLIIYNTARAWQIGKYQA